METKIFNNNLIPMVTYYCYSPLDPSYPFLTTILGNPGLIPNNSTDKPIPSDYPKGTFPCYDIENDRWVIKNDYRQITLYNKTTGLVEASPTIDLPPYLTDIKPKTKYDKWDEENNCWITDESKLNEDKINELKQKRSTELQLAKDQIEQLTEIVDCLDSSDEDYNYYYNLLKEWKTYRAKLNILKIENVNVKFPNKPAIIGE